MLNNDILDKTDNDVAARTCIVVAMPDKTYGVTYNKCDGLAKLSTLRNNVETL